MLLRYGTGAIEVGEEWEPYDVLEPSGDAAKPESALDVLAASLAKPVGSEPFDAVFRNAAGVVIIVPDHTRYAAIEHLLPEILTRLEDLGIGNEAIEILFALGIHEPQSDRQRRGIIGEEVASRIAYHDHDAYAAGVCEQIGETSRGTQIELNRRVIGNKKLLLIGSVNYHYFAGYGGGRKLILPGCASRRSCFANHLLIFENEGRSEYARVGQLERNPVHLDMVEACERVKPAFLINVILDERYNVLDLVSGDWRASHEAACEQYRERFSAPIAAPYDVAVVSCGGHPKDVTFIQAHKAIEMAFQIVEPGGTILAVAECAEGVGHPELLPWFRYERPEDLERELRRTYQIYGQTALATLTKARAADILLISSLPEDIVKTMHLHPVGGLDEAREFVRRKHGKSRRTCIMPHGAAVLPLKK
jgi:nickel-dependent lactate racemase